MAITHDAIGEVLDAIETTLEAVFATQSTVVTVMQDDDETTQDRVLEVAARGPAVLIAWTGTESGTYAAIKKSTERFAIGVFASTAPAATKHKRTSALRIAAMVSRIVADNVLGATWGLDGVERVSSYQSDNLSADNEGYALIVITWTQEVDFPDEVDPSTLEDLESVYSTVEVPDSPDGETKDEFNTEIPQS